MPVFSIKEARNHRKCKRYGPAVANYMSVLKCYPNKATILEKEFLDCFKHFCNDLENGGKVDEANEYFLLLSDIFKESSRFFCQWGDFMLRHGLHEEAALCFMKALSFEENQQGQFSRKAELALTDLRDQLVDQWHFRMLNDLHRNSSYEKAISQILARYKDPTVLDLGCGTSILSMLASKHGAKTVYACEHSAIMAYVAKKVLSVNQMTDKIVLYDKNSTDLRVPDDVPCEKINVLVTELMDAGFFGESIVSSILDVKKRLLTDDATIVPKRFEIYAVLIECAQIRNENFVDKFDGAGSIALNIPIVSSLAAEKLSKNLSEPYDSQMMNKVKNGFRYLSPVQLIYSANLNDVDSLENLKNGVEFEFALTLNVDGRVDAVVSWFNVELYDDIFISSAPSANSSWEQAVFPIVSTSCVGRIAEEMKFSVEIRDNWFRIILRCEETNNVDESFSRILTDSDVIVTLNDEVTKNTYRLFMESYQRTQNVAPIAKIIDVSGDPIVSFLAASIFTNSNVKTIADGDVRRAIEFLGQDNAELAKMIDVFSSKSSDERLKNDKIDVLLCNVVDWTSGLLKQNSLEDAVYYKLKYGPDAVIPNRMDVWAMGVESEELLRYTRVSDANTLGYRIKEVINIFDVELQREIELSTLQFRPLTEKRRIFSFNFNETIDDDTAANLLSQQQKRELCVVDDGELHVLLFWYELSCAECNVSLNTGDLLTRFKVAASVVNNSFDVRKNDTIIVDAVLQRSNFKFYVTKKV